jgi:hypothetical protein
MTNFIERAKRWFTGKSNPKSENPGSGQMLKKLLMAIEQTQEVEYDCGEVYQLLDQYADMVNNGEDATQLMPLVKHHLEMCPDCREEYDALMRVIENQPAEISY